MSDPAAVKDGAEQLQGQPLVLRDGTTIWLKDLAEAFEKSAHREVLLAALIGMVKQGFGEELQLFLAGLTIANTESAFREGTDVSTLERVAKDFPFSRWLQQMDVAPNKATRQHLIAWWECFMFMSGIAGTTRGQINNTGGTTNLWQATARLALKMRTNPAAYRFLPAVLVNHPQEVSRVLQEITDAIAFIEVLVGEAYEDMSRCPTFLAAFSTTPGVGGEADQINEAALYSIHLTLKRG